MKRSRWPSIKEHVHESPGKNDPATRAQQTGFSILVGEARGLDHYPPAMPGSHEVYCRLVFTRESLRLLGGQILGGPTTGELANEIGFLIQNRVTAAEIAGFQTCMHPRLTASAHPITEATGNALQQHLHTRATFHFGGKSHDTNSNQWTWPHRPSGSSPFYGGHAGGS